MKQKLSSMPDYTARMPRTPHVLSKSHAFTTAPGMIRCPYWIPVHTGDKLHFSGNIFTRFNPVIAPFIGRCKIYVDYFYVPLTVLYTPSSSMFYQTDDLVSGLFNKSQMIKDAFPVLNVDACLQSIASDDGLSKGQFKLDGSRLNPNVFDCAGKAAVRICEDFKYNPYSLLNEGNNNFNDFPYALLAYHAVYQLHDKYRNMDRQSKSYLYNVDSFYNSSDPFSDFSLFTLNYVDAESDYFNDTKVSPIGSSASMLSGTSSWDMLSKVNSYLYNDKSSYRVGDDGNITSILPSSQQDSSSTTTGVYSPTSKPQDPYLFSTSLLNAANIRQLFMVDKLLRVVGRADKNYESQFLAHFGVNIPHDVMHNITHLGQDMAILTPEPIVSTANTFDGTSGSSLGEVGGQGFVSQSFKKRSFEVPFHGVFLAMFYIIPEMRYQTVHTKLHSLNSPMDWWQPEYDRKGMQPLFQYEAQNSFYAPENPNARLGWQFGFEHFKRMYDDTGFVFWSPEKPTSVNNYSPWVLSKRPFHSGNDVGFDPTTQWEAFKSMPTDLNKVMQVPYSPAWIKDLTIENLHTLFYSDPFICDFRLNCVNVNFMSENSEPELY